MAKDYARDAGETTRTLDHEAARIRDALGMDAVRIVATGSVGGRKTGFFAGGSGNWHAQYGAICEAYADMTDSLGITSGIIVEDESD